jgi:N-acetylneuraminate synthase/N,N'-diacetyllegionaminate synthase
MKKVTIIAEIGINHNGNMNLAHEMIRQAALCGADVAKFQAYSVDQLFHPETGEDPNEEIWKGVKPLEFDRDQFVQIKKWCDEQRIEFMCSVFDEERLKWMEELGVEKHKIASRVSKLNPGLARKIVDTAKKCYMSLGFGAKRLDLMADHLCYLYCVSKYPTEYSDIHLPESFGGAPDQFCGFSDHSLGIGASLAAIGRGAKVIEKHFTLNKAAEGFDHVCSITPDELSDLVKYAREMEKVVK